MPFHDLPGKQQAAWEAMRQHLTPGNNTQSSTCASDGMRALTAHKGKQTTSAAAEIRTVNLSRVLN